MITCFDLETYLLAPGMVMPRMVCLSFAHEEKDEHAIGIPPLVLREPGLKLARAWLEQGRTLLGQNVCFDLGVLCAEDESFIPLVFKALDEGRILDTMLIQKMLDNANGDLKYLFDEETETYKAANFSLQNLVYRHLKKYIPKGEDTWRLRYAELDGVPISEWPEKAIQYAVGDAVDTLAVYEKQKEIIDRDFDGEIPGFTSTMQAAWALHLMGAWGIRTDGVMVAKLKTELEIDYADAIKRATNAGLVRESGKRDMKAIRAAVQTHYLKHSLEIPLTEKGQISTDRDCLNLGRYPSVEKHPGLTAVSDVVRIQKLLKTYIVALEKGTEIPCTPSYNVMVESFRTSCSGGGKSSSGWNVQNPPRKDGIRECVKARPGRVFVFADYRTLELCTLAQTCLDLPEVGFSRMAEVLNEGKDLHLDMAIAILGGGMDYAEAVARNKAGDPLLKEGRQFGKVVDFGCPGGLGAATLVEFARASGISIDERQAKDLIALYKRNWPEMEKYFIHIGNLCSSEEAVFVRHPRTGMIRGRVRYTAAANHYFQHLAAVGAKDALYQVSRECYLPALRSPLYGCRPVLFLHDEIGMEVPYDDPAKAARAADRLSEIMVTRMKFWCPAVPIEAEPVMSRRWFKGCEAAFVDGLLVPSRPEKYTEDDKEKVRWVADLDDLPGWERRAA
jgi:DNA polymerase-1